MILNQVDDGHLISCAIAITHTNDSRLFSFEILHAAVRIWLKMSLSAKQVQIESGRKTAESVQKEKECTSDRNTASQKIPSAHASGVQNSSFLAHPPWGES